MNGRERAVAREESVKVARWRLLHEKSDPLLRRYLGAAFSKTLADVSTAARPAGSGWDCLARSRLRHSKTKVTSRLTL